MNTTHILAIFMWATFCTMISCSIAICALSAILISWITKLSPPEIHSAVYRAFNRPTITLAIGLVSSGTVLVVVIFSIATLLVPTWRGVWRSKFVWPFVGLNLWMVAFVVNFIFCTLSDWDPCSVMSQTQRSLHPAAIPGAMGACRKLIALNILAVINISSMVAFPVACYHMYKPSARLKRKNKKNNEGNNEVDLSDLARHLDGIDDV